MTEIARVKYVYNTQYRARPGDYNYIWHARNPVSYTYRQAQERAIIEVLNQHQVKLEQFKILDLGCGGGGLLRFLASLGASPEHLVGVDLMEYRVQQAHLYCPPAVTISVEDAQNLSFPTATFDLVCQFTVLSSIHEQSVRERISSEITRVLKPDGLLLWYDVVTKRTGKSAAVGIEPGAVASLFPDLEFLAMKFLHHRLTARLAHRSWLLAELIERLPWISHTNILALLRKMNPESAAHNYVENPPI